MPHRSGFTLIELSIVLVVIGLVIGGILVGRDLINSAGNRAFIAQLEGYNSAVNTFKNKYNCLPGDCAAATAYGFTNNGNGNGMVTGLAGFPSWDLFDYNITGTDVNVTTELSCCGTMEAQYFWDHLRSALLIPEFSNTLTVADGVGSGFSLPPAKNDGSGIIATGWRGKHYFRSGATMTRGGGNVIYSINFSPADAAYIFIKMGGTTITTTNSHGDLYPDSLGKERVLVSNVVGNWPWAGFSYDTTFYKFQSQGIGGANADYCIDTSVTPAYFNLKNPNKLCALIIQAGF